MSTRSGFKAVKYFCGLIYGQEPAAEEALAWLEMTLGASDSRSEVIPFTVTDYYRAEMGEPLFRRFVSFRAWQPPDRLPAIKTAAMEREESTAVAGKRTVNLDPGYISEANVIIATAKNHYHRVPLRAGIYAHMEYVLKDGRIHFLPWTYPDFQSGPYLAFFTHLKEMHSMERKGKGRGV